MGCQHPPLAATVRSAKEAILTLTVQEEFHTPGPVQIVLPAASKIRLSLQQRLVPQVHIM